MPKAIVKLDGEIISFKKYNSDYSQCNGNIKVYFEWRLSPFALVLSICEIVKLLNLNDIWHYVLTTYYASDAKFTALTGVKKTF